MRVYKRIFSSIVVLFLAVPAFAQQGGTIVGLCNGNVSG
jgi:hypothetical protein